MMRPNLRAHLLTAGVLLVTTGPDPADAAPKRQSRTGRSSTLITAHGAGAVRLGMTLAEARTRLPGATLARTRDGEGVALVAVSRGKRTLFVLHAGEPDPDRPVNGKARIEWISVVDPAYRTPEGVRPGMPLKEVEKRWGRLLDIRVNEIEAREYARFARSPRYLWLRVSAQGSMAGIYSGSSAAPHARTQQYRANARLLHIEISTSSHD